MMNPEHPLYESYRVGPREILPFRTNIVAAAGAILQHGVAARLAAYTAQCEDGHAVEVFVVAMPARFYRIEVAAQGDKPGYTITTGSDMADLAHQMAVAISDGMLGFDSKDQENQ